MALTQAQIDARFPPFVPQPFRLTADRAAEILSLSPAARHIELQNEYSAHLHAEARRRLGALVNGPAVLRSVAKQWEAMRAFLMADAYAELERAGRRAAA